MKYTCSVPCPPKAGAPPVRLLVPPECDGLRLDRALAAMLEGRSREAVKRMIEQGCVEVDGAPCASIRRPVREGASVSVDLGHEQPRRNPFAPEDVEFAVVHEDADLIVVDKPAGVVVLPARGNWSGTILNGLLARYPELQGLPRAGIAHRIDKDTSGLLAVARSERSMLFLAGEFKARRVEKEYLAIVHGTPPGTGRIELPISRDRSNRLRMAVAAKGREALTTYRVLERYSRHSLLECRILTGRTHQIRVHLEAVGHPLLGDARYRAHAAGGGSPIGRQALHARKLAFAHPADGRPMGWSSPMPEDMERAIGLLKAHA